MGGSGWTLVPSLEPNWDGVLGDGHANGAWAVYVGESGAASHVAHVYVSAGGSGLFVVSLRPKGSSSVSVSCTRVPSVVCVFSSPWLVLVCICSSCSVVSPFVGSSGGEVSRVSERGSCSIGPTAIAESMA